MSIVKPVVWHAGRPAAAMPFEAVAPQFDSITIMLTELCNLDCWMCDFAVSKGLRNVLPWSHEQYIAFLQHPYFKHLRRVGFTGGEPFSYPDIKKLYQALMQAFPRLFISFSSNATLIKPMIETFEQTQNWKLTRLLTSIDGVASHDVQRGRPGAFKKSIGHLEELRRQFPKLDIDIKFTVTPVNYKELRDAYLFCTDRGFNFTVKMLENNPFYTNKLSHEQHQEDFCFTTDQIQAVREQLEWVLSDSKRKVSDRRLLEMREVLESLDPAWQRNGKCAAPLSSAFLDARLNLFTCKEYPPVLNLQESTLDDICASSVYQNVIRAEKNNAERCTRCTSQLKKPTARKSWVSWLS